MEKSTSRQRLSSAALSSALLIAATLVVAWAINSASGRQPLGATGGRDFGGRNDTGDTPANIRLRFFNANWATVLKKVAESSQSMLVMKEVPKGRFTRIDRKKYNRTEAVRILNRELEPKGFRLLEKGRFLDVIFLRSARSEYRRREIPRQLADLQKRPPQQTPKPRSRKPGRSVYTVPRSRQTRQTQRSRQTRQTPAAVQATGYNSRRLRRESDNPLAALQKSRPRRTNVRRQKMIRVIRPRVRRAVDIARTIYKSLQSRSRLIDRGPTGLPAFQVYQTDEFVRTASGRRRETAGMPGNHVRFSVGIDTGRNELVIDAPPILNRNVGELIRYIDYSTVRKNETLKVVPTNTDPTAIAEALRPSLQMLAQVNARNGKQPLRKQPLRKQPPAQPGKQVQQIIPKRVGGLNMVFPVIQGRVVIRDVPGVGLVIIGNEKDVEAVMKIIAALDLQARVTAPNVHVEPLRHVNSQALAELLTAVYQQLNSIRTGTTTTNQQAGSVAFVPVVRPNAIMILSSKTDLDPALKLIADLDRPVDPQKEFRVFRLKYAVASQIVANLDALFQEQQGQQGVQRGLAARVRAIADVRTNSVIVEALPNDMVAVSNLIRKFDQERVDSVSRVRFFPLKNAVANELAQLINTSIQSVINPPTITGFGGGGGIGAGGQASQQLRDAKSAILEFMTPGGNNRRLIRSGILADIRVTAQPRVNSLIVTAPETSMKLMEVLIKELDLPSSIVAEIKVFKLVNGDATAMITVLDTLFGAQTQQQGQTGVALALADDAGSGLIPLRFSVDARTNSIIAVGGTAALTVVEAVILRLDESDAKRRQTTVVRLKNAPAADISTAVNQFLQSQRDLASIDPNLVTNLELLEREIIVVPEPVTNSLLISTTPRYESMIMGLVEKLDAAPAQVIIQALLVEVELDNTDEFGIELGFQDSTFFDRGVISNLQTINQTITQPNGNATTNQTIISQERTPGFIFNNNPLGNNSSGNPSAVAKQALSNFSLGRVNGDLGYGGLVLSASSSSVSVLLRALSAQRTVHILSRPQITTLDNQLAQIQVGQQVPIVDTVTVAGTGVATPNIRQEDAGIILTVTPRISPNGTIVMEVVAEKSAFLPGGVPIFTDATTGNVITSPIKNITTARTTLAVPNGQTVVMGGMITKSDDTIQRKVPWLGDIPYLGYAFRFDSTAVRRTELLIFLTPRIIKNDADSEVIKQIEAERLHFIERDAERIHGPLYAVPAANASDHRPQPLPESHPPGSQAPGSANQTPGSANQIPNLDNLNVPTTIMPANAYRPADTRVQQTSFPRTRGESQQPAVNSRRASAAAGNPNPTENRSRHSRRKPTFFQPLKSGAR